MGYKFLLMVKDFIRQKAGLSKDVPIRKFNIAWDGEKLHVAYEVTNEIVDDCSPTGDARVKAVQFPKAVPVVKKGTNKNPVKTGNYSMFREFKDTAEDFSCLRVVLSTLIRKGSLLKEEVEIIAGVGGTKYGQMSEGQRSAVLGVIRSVQGRVKKEDA
jgi:hypothetical protein